MGQKYGYRPLQPRVVASEFERLMKAVESNEDCDLLKHWYWRDDNSVPPVYVLQPISSRLPHYNDLRDLELRSEARGKWWAAYERLHVIMRRAADKVLTKDERRKFYMSGESVIASLSKSDQYFISPCNMYSMATWEQTGGENKKVISKGIHCLDMSPNSRTNTKDRN